jgi:hypothetical protein
MWDGNPGRRRQADARAKEMIEDDLPADVDGSVAFVHDQQIVARAWDVRVDHFQRVNDGHLNISVL